MACENTFGHRNCVFVPGLPFLLMLSTLKARKSTGIQIASSSLALPQSAMNYSPLCIGIFILLGIIQWGGFLDMVFQKVSA